MSSSKPLDQLVGNSRSSPVETTLYSEFTKVSSPSRDLKALGNNIKRTPSASSDVVQVFCLFVRDGLPMRAPNSLHGHLKTSKILVSAVKCRHHHLIIILIITTIKIIMNDRHQHFLFTTPSPHTSPHDRKRSPLIFFEVNISLRRSLQHAPSKPTDVTEHN